MTGKVEIFTTHDRLSQAAGRLPQHGAILNFELDGWGPLLWLKCRWCLAVQAKSPEHLAPTRARLWLGVGGNGPRRREYDRAWGRRLSESERDE